MTQHNINELLIYSITEEDINMSKTNVLDVIFKIQDRQHVHLENIAHHTH